MTICITSFSNPRIKFLRGLSQRKRRTENTLMLVEGLKLVLDGVEAGWRLETLVFSALAEENAKTQALIARCLTEKREVLKVSPDILGKITKRDNPQSVIATFQQRTLDKDTLMNEAKAPLYVALDRVRDPGNLGTILRTADAVGAGAVFLIGKCTDVFGPECVRASMGSIFHVPVVLVEQDAFVEMVKTWPSLSVGTHLEATRDYREISYPFGTLLLMGNEQSGLSRVLAKAAKRLVHLPMTGGTDSLNLAVTTAIMAYEIRRNDTSFTLYN